MKILALGQTLLDSIDFKGTIQKKPGGIFYTIASLLSLKENDDELYLISEIPNDNCDYLNFFYEKINTNYSTQIDKPKEVYLKVEDNGDRIECFNFHPDKLKIPEIDFNEFDGILINMITGFEIDHNDLKMIRNKYSGPIYFDLHSLSRMRWDGKKRKYIEVKEVNKWIESIDLLQCNEIESKTLFGDLKESEIAKKSLNSGLSCLIITKGEKGASCYFYDNDQLRSLNLPAEKVEAKNHVGLGDGFGSAFFYYYLKYGSIAIALNAGVIFSSALAQGYDLKDFNKLKNYVETKL